MKRKSKLLKTEGNDEEKNNKNEDAFFLTQGNNEANTIGVSKNNRNEEKEKEDQKNDENNQNEIKEENNMNNNDENKEYNDEFEN